MSTIRRQDATRTTDRQGNSAYAWPSGYAVVRDGYGRMAWSLYRPEDQAEDGRAAGYFTDSLTDAIGNA